MGEDDANTSLVGAGPPQAGSIDDLQQNSSTERSETGNNNTEEFHNSISSWDEMVANHDRISYTLEQGNTGIPEIDEGEGFLDNKSRLVSDVNDNNERSISFKDDIIPAVDAKPDDDEYDEYNKHFRQATVSFAMNANRLAEGEYDDDDDDTNALRPSRNYNSRRESNRSNISQLTESEVKRKRLSMWKFESYELPQSTYTLLISEPVLSRAFLMGIVAAVLSIMSLSIVLVSELDNGTADSPLGLPTGVPPEVRMAQYLGKIHMI